MSAAPLVDLQEIDRRDWWDRWEDAARRYLETLDAFAIPEQCATAMMWTETEIHAMPAFLQDRLRQLRGMLLARLGEAHRG